ncbi:MAG: exo-alpha-sialidase, partial [Planctomycetes bacterium]|nr:exo-alpha-sialidase [Planctomycetota bacterium]
GGINWFDPVPAFGGDKQWIAVDDRVEGTGIGHIYQIWNVQFTCCVPDDFARSIDNGMSFPSSMNIPTPSMKWGTMDTGPDGTLYLAGSTLNQTGHLFTRSGDAKDPASRPTFDDSTGISLGGVTGGFGGFSGPNPSGLIGQVWIAADPSRFGRLYVLGSVLPPSADPVDVMFIRSVDDGKHWTAPIRVNDDAAGTNAWQWFGAMSVAPNGRIDSVWYDTRTTGVANLSAMFYSYSTDYGNTWSTNVQVTPTFNSHVGFPNQNKLGDYIGCISDNGGVSVAYAATFNGEQDVWFLRIPRDCDGNGIDDDCDVACGVAGTRCDVKGCGMRGDCNGNDVPDLCEPDDDCNKNEIRDLCEIGKNPNLDCDGNNVLDSCQPSDDCNDTLTPDFCDLADGTSQDCNRNGIPDECDIAGPESNDENGDGVPDECLAACCSCGCEERTAMDCLVRGGISDGMGSFCDAPDACTPNPTFINDECIFAQALPSDPEVVIPTDNRCATTDGPPDVPCSSSQPFGADLWYTYVAPCNGTINLHMCGLNSYDAILAVYGGGETCQCPTDNASLITCGDDTCGFPGGTPTITFNVVAGGCYSIRVGGWAGSTGVSELNLVYTTMCPALPEAPQPEPDGQDKNRFLSMVIPEPATSAASAETALQVTPILLHRVCSADSTNLFEPCLFNSECVGGRCEANFTPFEGKPLYVNAIRMCRGGDELGEKRCTSQDDCDARGLGGTCEQMQTCVGGTEPGGFPCGSQDVCDARIDPRTGQPRGGTCRLTMTCEDSPIRETTFQCAVLGCQPEYRNWASDLAEPLIDGPTVLHVAGSAIMPGRSDYLVRQLDLRCQGQEAGCTSVSEALAISTARWGDVNGDADLSVRDVETQVDKLKDVPTGTLSKPRTQLNRTELDPTGKISVVEIQLTVDALKSLRYPFRQLVPCP